MMGLGAVIPDILADLQFLELLDAPRADNEGNHQRGERRENRPEGDVPEDIEPSEDRFQ
jgi:hypothetical protein